MSKYKVFAVIGIGDIGTHVVDGFVAQGVVPVILTRKSSNTNYATKFPGSSLTVVRVESYEDVEEVANALKGNNIEVVVCTLANAVLALQYPLAEAAKQAGVKLFIPSEYGFVTQGASKAPKAPSPEQSILVWKDQFAGGLSTWSVSTYSSSLTLRQLYRIAHEARASLRSCHGERKVLSVSEASNNTETRPDPSLDISPGNLEQVSSCLLDSSIILGSRQILRCWRGCVGTERLALTVWRTGSVMSTGKVPNRCY
ncbi:hypothetical protein PQX77_011432 [Marasmius sp. AFHP31]|nr:hypothetical protein PQX77_011432 [Marasmius sp. AFHP31]